MTENEAITSFLEKSSPIKCKAGDLLAFKIKNPPSVYAGYHFLRKFHQNIPTMETDAAAYNHIAERKPFMFLGWAAYNTEWQNNFLTQAYELKTHIVENGERKYSIGMNILVLNKIMFLSCNHLYGLHFLHNCDPTRIYLIHSILVDLEKL